MGQIGVVGRQFQGLDNPFGGLLTAAQGRQLLSPQQPAQTLPIALSGDFPQGAPNDSECELRRDHALSWCLRIQSCAGGAVWPSLS